MAPVEESEDKSLCNSCSYGDFLYRGVSEVCRQSAEWGQIQTIILSVVTLFTFSEKLI